MAKYYLWVSGFAALLAIILGNFFFLQQVPVSYIHEMKESMRLASEWRRIVYQQKLKSGLPNNSTQINHENYIIGDEYTETTTTLGSLEAKELSNNELFPALMIKLVHDSKADPEKPVGIIASGSFPALFIETLAALQTMHRKVVIIYSLGASSFGANQPAALLPDIEGWIQKYGGCQYHADLITYGAEGDTAGGLIDEGKAAFDSALRRNGKTCFFPRTIEESIQSKCDLFLKNNIGLLINIGGNQTALGYCSHAELIPNGLHTEIVTCNHPERGVVSRISEKHIPFIHLLNIKNLAMQYAITDTKAPADHPLYYTKRPNKILAGFAIIFIFAPVIIYYFKTKK